MLLLKAIWDKIVVSEWFRYLMAFCAGLAVCYFVYPTKTIEDRVKQEYQLVIDQKVAEQKQVTSEVQKKLDISNEQYSALVSITNQRLDELKSQLKEVTAKATESWHKVTKPDGSTEEWRDTTSESQQTEKIVSELRSEYEQKLTTSTQEIQKKSESEVVSIRTEYEKQISTLKTELATKESETITTINAKKFGLEIGAKPSKRLYVHGTYDIIGPVFVGIHAEQADSAMDFVGAGIGIRL